MSLIRVTGLTATTAEQAATAAGQAATTAGLTTTAAGPITTGLTTTAAGPITAGQAATTAGQAATTAGRRLVDGVSFEVDAGQTLAVIGASGSGKTTVGRALLGEAGPGVRLSGRVEIAGRTVSPLAPPPPGLVGHLPQQPSAVLNPVRRIGTVLTEIARRHRTAGVPGWRARRDATKEIIADALRRVALPTDRELLRRFPHQLSGGQQQRLVLAHALLSRCRVLVVDEPTTGQDAVVRREVATQLRTLVDSGVADAAGIALVLLSHDLELVRELAGRVLVLRHGLPVESGPTADVLTAPRHGYTRSLVTPRQGYTSAPVTPPPDHTRTPATPRQRNTREPDTPELPGAAAVTRVPLLTVAELRAGHRSAGRRHAVLHGIGLEIVRGRCLAVVGRSGSGKTTLARCLAGLHPAHTGTVRLAGRPLPSWLGQRERADVAAVQYVFQDARASFDPYRPVVEQVARTGVRLRGYPARTARREALDLLDRLGLARATVEGRPDLLSGGELQRAALARALLANPSLLICDEITTGLDGPAEERILSLVDELRRTLGLALMVITHDRTVVDRLADSVLVLDEGRIVERGPATRLLTAARHPLTRALLAEPGGSGR